MRKDRILFLCHGHKTVVGIVLFAAMVFLFFFFYYYASNVITPTQMKFKKPKIYIENKNNLTEKATKQNISQLLYCEFNQKLVKLYSKFVKENVKISFLNEINKLIKYYNCNQVESSKPLVNKDLDVCPDKYMGQKYGKDLFYFSGFNIQNCTNAKPFHEVLTIALNFVHCFPKCNDNLIKILKEIDLAFKSHALSVVLAIPDPNIKLGNFTSLKVELYNFSTSVGSGFIWNFLIQKINTPYVFVGHDIVDFSWYAQLQRQVLALTQLHDVVLVGGAIRTPDSYWNANCYQLTLENYILKYQIGYYYSSHECMYCNYINGPFMTRIRFLKEIKFNISMADSVLFMDFFIKVMQSRYNIASCPDAMNFVNGNYFTANTEDWLSLARKHVINKIILPNNEIKLFSCEELSQSCNILYASKYYMMPPCCREKIVKAVNIVHNFFESKNLSYVVMDGTMLGCVKVFGVMPWDVDVDIFYSAEDYNVIKSEKYFWEKNGFKTEFWPWTTKTINTSVLIEGRIRLYFNGMYIELTSKFDAVKFHDSKYTKTKMKFDNVTVYGPTSPGLAARNMYGVECLRHAQSYVVLNIKSWSDYSMAGSFLSCNKPNFHACLDHFPADGNIDYIVP